MSIWLLLAVPASLVILAALVLLSDVAERRLLSPRSLILSAVRTQRNTPEYTEEFVASQFERLLRESQRR